MKIKGQDGSLAQLPLLLHMCVYFLNTVGSLCTSGQAVQSDYLVWGFMNGEQAHSLGPFPSDRAGRALLCGPHSHMEALANHFFFFFYFLVFIIKTFKYTHKYMRIYRDVQWIPLTHFACILSSLITPFLSILPLVEIWIVSNFWLLRIKLLWPLLYMAYDDTSIHFCGVHI